MDDAGIRVNAMIKFIEVPNPSPATWSASCFFVRGNGYEYILICGDDAASTLSLSYKFLNIQLFHTLNAIGKLWHAEAVYVDIIYIYMRQNVYIYIYDIPLTPNNTSFGGGVCKLCDGPTAVIPLISLLVTVLNPTSYSLSKVKVT